MSLSGFRGRLIMERVIPENTPTPQLFNWVNNSVLAIWDLISPKIFMLSGIQIIARLPGVI